MEREKQVAGKGEEGQSVKGVNVGLNLFRILLTLGVVMDHFFGVSCGTGLPKCFNPFLSQLKTLAVPAFMTMTLLFTARHFTGCDGAWVKKRFFRLYEPFLFWAIAYFLVRNLISIWEPSWRTGFGDLLWQFALGHSSKMGCPQFWFHTVLIIFTALFYLFFRAVKCSRANVYLALGIIAIGFTVQYDPTIKKALFAWMPYETKYPLGRLFAMMPCAGVGFLLAAVRDRIDGLSAGVKAAIALAGLWFAWIVTYYPLCPSPSPSVFGYEGLRMPFVAWGLMAAFYFLPFDRMPAWVTKVVLGVSKYAMGVYCIHTLVGKILFQFVFHIPYMRYPTWGAVSHTGLWFSVVTCALSYLICYLIALIPGKFTKRVVQ